MIMIIIPGDIKAPRSLALELDKCGLFSSSSFITRIKTCPKDGRRASQEFRQRLVTGHYKL